MADSFTPHYNLVLPTPGGDTNTWGTLLNGNTSAIDTAIYNAQTTANAAVPATGATPMTGNLTISAVAPSVILEDTAATLPAGRFKVVSTGGVFDIERNTATAGDFSTYTTPLYFDTSDVGHFLARPLFNGNTPWDSGNFTPSSYTPLATYNNFVTNTYFPEVNSLQSQINSKQPAGNYAPAGNYVVSGTSDGVTITWSGSSLNAAVNGVPVGEIWTSAVISPFYASDSRIGQAWHVGSGAFLVITVDGTQYQIGISPSDARLKDIIGPAHSALGTINAIELVNFAYKKGTIAAGEEHKVGFIAQQLREVNPTFVHGSEETGTMLGVNLMPIVAYLVKSVQELTAQIADLKAGK